MKMLDETRLSRTPPFCQLGMRQLREALDQAEMSCPTGGTVIFDEGQPARRFYLLLSGCIRFLRLTAEGNEVIVLHIPHGQMFGLGAAVGQLEHQATAVTADDCQILSWPNALWPEFTKLYEGFAAETFRTIGVRADEMSNRIVELSTKVVEQRIACALLRMIGQSGREVAGGVAIGFPITRQNVADMTGTTIYTVSRLLSVWERRGLVKSARCIIVVTDPKGLAMMSAGSADIDGADTSIPAGNRKPEPLSAGAVAHTAW
ncbi:Crp/Fnr family transcriptional regulator [Hoeflea sp.]|uniref:Crp/Fnr family transcriptional regulator n=1 Tax=Hoeflea sp. TaxID=1940281 RepID=UPI0019A72A5E|nr:Crp/Fnr family transcriptional regulator [Hoeflea sp.]MBC7281582.1 Crp/Fnr family transcriptional regulator [Hoeflea sp.]